MIVNLSYLHISDRRQHKENNDTPRQPKSIDRYAQVKLEIDLHRELRQGDIERRGKRFPFNSFQVEVSPDECTGKEDA